MSTSNNVTVTYEHLAVDNAEVTKIAVVSLDRGNKLNGLTLEMLTELSAVSRKLAADRDLRGVILRGEGKSFCAGLDFASAFKKPSRVLRSFVPDIHGTNLFQRACWDWSRLPVPVIAAVHGHCYGGGLQIALGADFRITTSDAKWSILEAKWGLIPDMSGMRTILDEVSADTARWLTMSGEELSGADATEIGLATWTVETEAAALDLAKEKLAQLATRSPDQLAATKRLFRDVHRSPRATFRAERTQQLILLARKNTTIIRNAAMKKVSPKFARRGTWARG